MSIFKDNVAVCLFVCLSVCRQSRSSSD